MQQNCPIFSANLVMNLSLFIDEQCASFNKEFIHKLNQFDLGGTFSFPSPLKIWNNVLFNNWTPRGKSSILTIVRIFFNSCITNFAVNNLVMEIVWNTKVSKFCVRMLCV